MTIDALPRTSTVIEDGMAAGLHLGAQVYVSQDRKVVADDGIGESRSGVSMTTDNMIVWFSMTKATMAVSTAQLWERGLVDLDDPVATYVPEFAANGKERVTLRHLLTHTGGFRPGDQVRSEAKDPEENFAEVVAGICATGIEDGWEPGKRAGYHLTCGMTMLAEVLRRVDGRFYSQYVRDEVFVPLGMDDCWVGMPLDKVEEYTAAGRIGTMHSTAAGAAVPLAQLDSKMFLTHCSPGGGGRGPMNQLARMYEALLGNGERDGVRILGPQTVAAITARHRAAMFDETFGVVTDWGLGFGIDSGAMGRHCSPRTFGHGGAMSSMAYCDPEHGVVVAIQCNGMPSSEDHYKRFHAISNAVFEDLGIASPDDPGRDKPLPGAGLSVSA